MDAEIKAGQPSGLPPGTKGKRDGVDFIVLGNGNWFDLFKLNKHQRLNLELDIRDHVAKK